MVCEYSARTAGKNRSNRTSNVSEMQVKMRDFAEKHIHMNAVWMVPCFLNDSYLLVEINELDQLFLQYFLSADNLFDEHMLEQV